MFKGTNIITVCFCIITCSTTYSQREPPPNAEDEVIGMEKSFALAIKSQDTSQAKQFLSDTYFLAIGVQEMPLQILPRDRWLASLKDYVTESFTIDDIKVHVYSNTAVALMLYTQKATVRGQDRSAQFFITDVWVKGETGWRISERHSSRPEVQASVRPK